MWLGVCELQRWGSGLAAPSFAPRRRPAFFNAKKPGGWRIVASAAELENNFEFEDLSEGDESGGESDDESDDGNGDDEGGSRCFET